MDKKNFFTFTVSSNLHAELLNNAETFIHVVPISITFTSFNCHSTTAL